MSERSYDKEESISSSSSFPTSDSEESEGIMLVTRHFKPTRGAARTGYISSNEKKAPKTPNQNVAIASERPPSSRSSRLKQGVLRQTTQKRFPLTQDEIDEATNNNTAINSYTEAPSIIELYHRDINSELYRPSQKDVVNSKTQMTIDEPRMVLATSSLKSVKLRPESNNTNTLRTLKKKPIEGKDNVDSIISSPVGKWIIKRLSSHNKGNNLVIEKLALVKLSQFIECFAKELSRLAKDNLWPRSSITDNFDAALTNLLNSKGNDSCEMSKIIQESMLIETSSLMPSSLASTAFSRRLIGHLLDVMLLARVPLKMSKSNEKLGLSAAGVSIALEEFHNRVTTCFNTTGMECFPSSL